MLSFGTPEEMADEAGRRELAENGSVPLAGAPEGDRDGGYEVDYDFVLAPARATAAV